MGGTMLVSDPDIEVKQNLLNTDNEQDENNVNNKKKENPGDCDLEKGSDLPARKPWTRRKLTLKITVGLIVIALAITGVVLGVINRPPKVGISN